MKEALQYLLARCNPYDAVPGADQMVMAVAEGVKLQDIEKFQSAPNRIRATAELASSESFCDYINRFKDPESSIYIDVANGVFQAVLDHHAVDAPTWREHTASFRPKKSMEWNAWTEVHEEWLKQIDFALLIERLLDTIHQPEPNGVLKAALDFQANESLALNSATNLDDGTVRFLFQKDNASKTVVFPHRIKLRMPVHENEDSKLLDARIRYKVTGDGVLAFKFSFVHDPAKVERDALLELAKKTKAATEGLAHYEGTIGRKAG